MYSAVLMLAMTTGTDLADFGRRGGCSGGCYGGGYYGGGCCGGGGYGGYRSYYGGGGYYGPSYAYMPGQYSNSGYAYMPGQSYMPGQYSSSTYLPGQYYGPNGFQNQGTDSRQSFYFDPNQNFASVRVMLPNPDAEVWFDNAPTQQRGFERFYHTPALDANSNYGYTIKARWTEGGKTVNQERKVNVRPGQASFVDFRMKEGENLQDPRGNNPNPNPNLNPNPNPNVNPRPNPDNPNTNPKTPPPNPNPKGSTTDNPK